MQEVGDMFEVKAEGGGHMLTPKSPVDRIREIAPTPQAIKNVQEECRREAYCQICLTERPR